MHTLLKVEECTNKLIDAAKAFKDQCQPGYSMSSAELTQPRHNFLALMAEMQVLLFQPADFLRHLAMQTQLLSCLQWLGDFQVLACIPLNSSVQVQDISNIASVPESQLTSILRMMTIAGFLREPQTGYIAHTPLSASFVTKPSYLDAALFLAETAAPTALNMTSTTKVYGQSNGPSECAYSLAFNTTQSLWSSCTNCPKLQRRFSAYTRYLDSVDDADASELLCRLDWLTLGKARIADVAAKSVSSVIALAKRYPSLNFIIQTSNTTSVTNSSLISSELADRISVQERPSGQPQVIKDAAVYMVRLTSSVLETSFVEVCTQILAELQAHLGILRANPAATLILQVRILPKATSVDHCIRKMAHVLDLSLLQFGNERTLEISDLIALVGSVHCNGNGRLVVVKKMSSQNSAFVILGVKCQTATVNVESSGGPALPFVPSLG